MKHRIGVIGVCDTAGLANALRQLLPGNEVKAITLPKGGADEQRDWLLAAHRDFDLMLVNKLRNLPHLQAMRETGLECVEYPHITFHAFHPDLAYVGRSDDGPQKLINIAYNSCIVIWCFINGVPAARVPSLFNAEVFEALGYFDEWEPSVATLRGRFSDSGLNYANFHLAVKRAGPFMLSHDHPRIGAIVALARRIALDKLGAPEAVAERPIYVADHLAPLGWPVYPEIAELYGSRGSYLWDFEGRVLDLPGYVEAVYARYGAMNLLPERTFFGRQGFRERINTVLGARLGS